MTTKPLRPSGNRQDLQTFRLTCKKEEKRQKGRNKKFVRKKIKDRRKKINVEKTRDKCGKKEHEN
jgi:hypothetical protein